MAWAFLAVTLVLLPVFGVAADKHWFGGGDSNRPQSERTPPEDRPRASSSRDVEWAGAALELKRQVMARFFERRRLEWRVSLALWASVAVIATAGAGERLLDRKATLLYGGAAVLALLHGAWTAAFVVREARRNRDEGVGLDAAIRAALNLDPAPPPLKYLPFIAHMWAPLVTLVLGYGAVLLLSLPVASAAVVTTSTTLPVP